MTLTRLVSAQRLRLVGAIALAALPLLLSTCRLDSLFQSRAPKVVITIAGDTVAVSDSVELEATVTLDDNPPKTPLPLTWRSSNPDVAAVDSTSGVVRGLTRGTSVISVRLAESALGEVSAEDRDTVRVIAASVTLAPGDTTLQSVDDTLCYRATALDAAGGTIAGAIPDLRIVADPDATVELVDTNGCVAARRNGAAATIEASLDTSTATGTLTVRQHVTSIEIPVDSDTLFGLGSTETYPASPRDRRGNLAPAATVDWTSSNSSIISVDATGRATAQGEGVAYVRARADDGADSVAVTVTPPRLMVMPDTARAAAAEGNTVTRTAKLAVANTGTGSITWSATGGGSFLRFNKSSGTAPDTLTLTFDPAGLTAATYQVEVIITSPPAAGSPDTTPVIFTITPPTTPSAPQALAQLRTDGSTAIAQGGTTDETSAIFRAQATDADADATIVLEVELKPVGTAFTGTPTGTSATVVSGQTATVTLGGLVDNTDYHWQARARDETGLLSPWTSFGNNAETAADFHVAIPVVLAQSTVNANPTSGVLADGVQASIITVQLKDAAGNNTTSGAGSGVTATATNGASISSFTTSGGGTYTAWLTSTTAATSVVSAKINGANITHGSNPVSVTFMAGAAAKFVVTGTGTQTAGNAQTVTVTAQDAFGNPATSYAGDKVLTFSGAGTAPSGTVPTATDNTAAPISFGAATTVTFASGVVTTTSMVLYKAETALIAVSAAGPINTAAADRLSVTVSGATATTAQSTVTASPTSLTADGASTSTITIQLKDVYQNNTSVVSGLVALATDNGTLLVGLTNNGGGNYTQSLQSTTTAGTTATLIGKIGGVPIATTASVTFLAGPAAKFVVSGGETQTAGFSQIVTITAQDAFGNTATGYTGGKSLTFSGAGSAPLGAVPTATDNTVTPINFGTATTVTFTSGTATTSMVLYKAETAAVAVTDGVISATEANRLSVTVSPADASTAQSTVSANPISGVLADGIAASTITVQLKDAYQNITTTGVTTVSATLTGTATTASIGPFATTGGGTYTAFLTSTTVGTAIATAKLDGSTITHGSNPVTVTFTTSVLEVTGSATQTAGGAQTVTIRAKDGTGTVMSYAGDRDLTFSGASVALTGENPTAIDKSMAVRPFGSVTTLTFTLGVATTSMVLYKAETATIAVTDGVISATGANRLTITVSGTTATQLVLTGSAAQTAGTSQTVTVTAQDGFKNTSPSYAGDKSLTFSGAVPSPSNATPTVTDKNNLATNFGTPTTVTFTNGAASRSMVLYKAEAATIGVTDGMISAAGANQLSVTVSAADASTAQSTVSADPTTNVLADGMAASTITVQLKDAFQNTTTTGVGSGVTATATNGASLTAFTTGGGGTYTASLTSTTAATSVVTAKINGVNITNPVSVTFIAGPAAKFLVTGTGTQTAGTAQTVTITAKDAFGNTATTYIGDKSLIFSGAGSAPLGTAPTATNNTPAPIAFGAATTVTFTNGVATSSVVLYKAETALIAVSAAVGPINTASADRLSVTVSPNTTSAAQSSVIANPTTGVVADGVTTSQVTVTLKDPYANVVPGKTVSLDDAGRPSIISPAGTSNPSGQVVFTVTDTLAETVTYTATALDPGPIVLTSTPTVTFVPGPLDHFLVGNAGGGPIPTRTAGQSFNIRVVAQDAKNNTVTSFEGAGNTVNLTSSSTISVGGGTTATFASGVLASHAITLTTSGTHTISATRTSGGAQSGTSNSFTVDPAGLDHFLVEQNAGGNIGTQTSGVPFEIRITARDQFSNTATSFTGTANITSDNPLVLLTSGALTGNFVAGVRTGHSVTLTSALLPRTTFLVATDAGGTGKRGESNPFTVNP